MPGDARAYGAALANWSGASVIANDFRNDNAISVVPVWVDMLQAASTS